MVGLAGGGLSLLVVGSLVASDEVMNSSKLPRSVLPVATYSHMFASVNLLNLLKFLTLRCHSHAQYEIRVYAEAMRDLIRPIVPVCVAARKTGQSA